MPERFRPNEETGSIEYTDLVQRPIKEKLLELARAGISYLDLAKIAKGEQVEQDPSHDYLHTLRVLKLAEVIAKEIGGDERTGVDLNVIRASVAFHDMITRPKSDPASVEHDTEESAQYSADLLKELKFTDQQIRKVQDAIRQSSFRRGLKPETIEAKILFTADKLDQSGAVAIMRYFSSGGIMNRPSYSPEDPFAQHRKTDSLGYTLDALIERLPQIEQLITAERAKRQTIDINPVTLKPIEEEVVVGREDIIATPNARAIIKRRNIFFEHFNAELEIELVELQSYPNKRWLKETGVFAIMSAFEGAGRTGQTFYNSEDPMRLHTRTQPKKYPLDGLINQSRRLNKRLRKDMPEEIAARRKVFLDQFLEEVRLELEGQ